MLLPQIHLLCLPYIWLYPEFIKAFFSLSFLFSVLPLLLFSFHAVYVGIWNLTVSKKSLQIQKTRASVGHLAVGWTLELWHCDCLFLPLIGLLWSKTIFAVQTQAEAHQVVPRVSEFCSSNPIRHWPVRGRTGHVLLKIVLIFSICTLFVIFGHFYIVFFDHLHGSRTGRVFPLSVSVSTKVTF